MGRAGRLAGQGVIAAWVARTGALGTRLLATAALTGLVAALWAPRVSAWETNDDALRILASRLGSSGVVFANLATLVESAGAPAQKKALEARVPADVVGPIEHLPVDVPYDHLPPVHRERLAGALAAWARTSPALAPALQVAEAALQLQAPSNAPADLGAFQALPPNDPVLKRQLHQRAVAYVSHRSDDDVVRFVRTHPIVAGRVLRSFEDNL